MFSSITTLFISQQFANNYHFKNGILYSFCLVPFKCCGMSAEQVNSCHHLRYSSYNYPFPHQTLYPLFKVNKMKTKLVMLQRKQILQQLRKLSCVGKLNS